MIQKEINKRNKRKGVTWVLCGTGITLILIISLCWLFPTTYTIIIPLVVFIFLTVLWIKNPGYLILHFFGDDKKESTNAKILKYIGVIIGSIIVILNLLEYTETNKLNAETNALTKKGQLDTRFKDAATLLGSENTSTTIAGIYALHQIAREASVDQNQKHYPELIANILTSTIKEEFAFIPPEKPMIIAQTIITCLSDTIIYVNDENYVLKLDLYYLAGANLEGIDLSRAELPFIHLASANLQRANLRETNLQGANLYMANLDGVKLRRANLSGANLMYASLQNSNLEGANLQSADLQGANLQGAHLSGANLEGANLLNVKLLNIMLRGPVLECANLQKAKLCFESMQDVMIAEFNDEMDMGFYINALSIHDLDKTFSKDDLKYHFVFKHEKLQDCWLVDNCFRGAIINKDSVEYVMPMD